MSRRSNKHVLRLWMNGAFVGTWTAKPNSTETLVYDAAWSASDQGRSISLSLPFTPGNAPLQSDRVRNFFENLLPDNNEIRKRVASRFQLGSTDAFELLREAGRDCVGALQVLPDDMTPTDVQTVNATRLSDAEVAQVLRDTLSPRPLGGRYINEEDFRISIAGAQEKTALLWFNGHWCRPHGSTPTTHIFKMPLGLIANMQYDMSESVENEWLCSEILHAYGLPVARTKIEQFEDMKVLVVERFDRVWWDEPGAKPWLIRLPQEDMCQATGTAPHLKYESDGGPGVSQIMKLLGGSLNPVRDRRTFFQAQVLFWMLGAIDGHAKNFSIFIRKGGAYELAPLYDVLSAYPFMGNGAKQLSPFKAKLAMAVRSKNAHWKIREIQRKHWLAMGSKYGVVSPEERGSDYVLDDLVARTPDVVSKVSAKIPAGFPQRVADTILEGLQAAANKLGG